MNFTLIFRGAKEIVPFEFDKAETPSMEEFWGKLFDDYRLPLCPFCKKRMQTSQIFIQYISPLVSRIKIGKSHLHPQSTEVQITFICPNCGTIMSGWGLGIKFDLNNHTFTVEKFGATELEREVRQIKK